MTLSLNKTTWMILLIILFILLAITGVYGGYQLVLEQAGNQLPTDYFTEPVMLMLGCFVALAFVVPVVLALRLIKEHKKTAAQ
jgi:hypothetical protein